MNEFPITDKEIISISDLIHKKDDNLALIIFNETKKGFESIGMDVRDEVTILRWHISKKIFELGTEHIEVLFWSFRFFLLHYIGIPLDLSKLDMDVAGEEGIDPSEFSTILNFVIQRYFDLNRILERVVIEVVFCKPVESLNPIDYVTD
jgi:hypothetical protein